MTDALVEKFLKEQDDVNLYNFLTQEQITSVKDEQEKVRKEQCDIQEAIETVNTLSEHACVASMVQLSPICYVPAVLKHTGEYNVFFNTSYQCTLTYKQTVEYLNRKHSELEKIVEGFDSQLEQLMQRISFEQFLDEVDTSEMPNVIKSEKGVAVKRGSFYDIIEEDQVEPTTRGQRISRVRK